MANFCYSRITGTRIIWANKGDSGVCFPIKHGNLNTYLFVLPSEILLNERKRNGGRKGRKEGGRENEGGRRIDNRAKGGNTFLEDRKQMKYFKRAENQVLTEGLP